MTYKVKHYDREYIPIYVMAQALSDGSRVFNVALGDTTLQAVTEKDAETLAESIAFLIRKHTNDEALPVYRNIVGE